MSGQLISLKHVSKHYRVGEVTIKALQDVDLEIGSGEFIVILGPSGSGKTTLLNMVGGLDTPTSGQIIVDDNDLVGYSERQLTEFRKGSVGFVFQFFNLIPTLTARENIALAADLTGQDGLSIDEVLRAVGLSERADHFPSQLSGGEQQRVAIARALAKNTSILLCDEPTGELDYETGIKILALLKEVSDKYDKTFLIVTHNAAIAQIAERVVRLRSGAISEDRKNENIIPASELRW